MERSKVRLANGLSLTQRSTPPPQLTQSVIRCKESALLQRRRRCKSEGLETSPFERKFIDRGHETCTLALFNNRMLDGMPETESNKLVNRTNGRREQIWSQSDYGNYKYNYSCYPDITDKMVYAHTPSRPSNGRKNSPSPVGNLSPKCKVIKEGNNYYSFKNGHSYDTHDGLSHRSRSPNRLIENEKPRISKFYDSVPFLEHCLIEYGCHKTPLKSIVNNKRRSVSPPSKKKGPSSPVEKLKLVSKPLALATEGRRRQRAISESDCHYCLSGLCTDLPNICTQETCESGTLKRAREDFSRQFYNIPDVAPRIELPLNCTNKEDTQAVEENLKFSDPSQRLFNAGGNVKNLSPSSSPMPVIRSSPVIIKPLKSRLRVTAPDSPSNLTNGGTESNKSTGSSDEKKSSNNLPPQSLKKGITNTMVDQIMMDIDKWSSVQMQAKLKGYTTEGGAIGDMILDLPKSSQSLELWQQCTRPSLFPNVGAYLRFYTHDLPHPIHIPPALARHLKWRLTTITPVVVRRTLTNSGFKLIKSDTDVLTPESDYNWVGIWGKHMKSICFKTLREGQKMNHFPGSFHIGRKDRLWRNLQKMVAKYGKSEFGMMPLTYVLPHDLKLLKRDWEKHVAAGEKWIIKPPASARGTGIKVVSRWTQIPKRRPIVVQRYIARPLLIHDSKFDIRLYVLVTSMHPLRIYLYPDGLARFASVKYSEEVSSLQDRYMHLTNYSINRLSKTYQQNEEADACQGHKWTLRSLLSYLEKERNVNVLNLWEKFKDVVIKTIICGEANITAQTRTNVPSRYNCYELFGIDILLDEELKPWLLEVNISPSLHSASPLDLHVKGPLVTTLLNMAQYHVPAKVKCDSVPYQMEPIHFDKRLYTVYLSKEEKEKHEKFTSCQYRSEYLEYILSELTADDIRHLIQAEDELVAAAVIGSDDIGVSSSTMLGSGVPGVMERIFPTTQTHTYHKFLSTPRYYNRLFDAWEHKYATKRNLGIKLLQCLCNIGKHLEVPSTPIKNDSDVETGSATTLLIQQQHVTTECPSAEAEMVTVCEGDSPAPARRRRLHSPLRRVACRDCDTHIVPTVTAAAAPPRA